MKKTINMQLNKPDLDDRVHVQDLNQNADNIDSDITQIRAILSTKAPIDSPKFFGTVLAPKPGADELIHEQVATVGYVIDVLQVENLDINQVQ